MIHEAVLKEKARKTGAYRGWIEMFDKLELQLQSIQNLIQQQHEQNNL